MLGAVIDEVLVHFIGEHKQIMLNRDLPSASSSLRENTLPEGFEGLLRMIARVRGVIAACSRSVSSANSGAARGTTTGTDRIARSVLT